MPLKRQFTGKISLDPDIDGNKFGSRATTLSEPGMFAANNFFDSRSAVKRALTNHPYDARAELSGSSETLFTNGQITRPDGTTRKVRSRARPMADTAGRIIRLIGTSMEGS